jgi:hypothetical protein
MPKPTVLQTLLGRPSRTYADTPAPPAKNYHSAKQEFIRIATQDASPSPGGSDVSARRRPSTVAEVGGLCGFSILGWRGSPVGFLARSDQDIFRLLGALRRIRILFLLQGPVRHRARTTGLSHRESTLRSCYHRPL